MSSFATKRRLNLLADFALQKSFNCRISLLWSLYCWHPPVLYPLFPPGYSVIELSQDCGIYCNNCMSTVALLNMIMFLCTPSVCGSQARSLCIYSFRDGLSQFIIMVPVNIMTPCAFQEYWNISIPFWSFK